MEIRDETKEHTLLIYTDGGSRGNPGSAAFCVLFLDSHNNELYKHAEFLGKKTNNQAELSGILHALKKAPAFCRGKIRVFSDSECAVCWLNGEYRVKSENIRPLFDEIQDSMTGTRFKSVEFIHVPRENKFVRICDAGVNKCLDENTGH